MAGKITPFWKNFLYGSNEWEVARAPSFCGADNIEISILLGADDIENSILLGADVIERFILLGTDGIASCIILPEPFVAHKNNSDLPKLFLLCRSCVNYSP